MRSTLRSLLAVPVLFAGGCSDGIDKFPVAKTSGIVLCEGQPVPGAEVYFEPLRTGDSALVGKQAFAFSGDDGRFVLSSYGDGDGAVVGKHRVRVGGDPRKCSCVLDSERDVMEVEIVDGQDHDFELVLPKKTARDKPTLPYEYDDAAQ